MGTIQTGKGEAVATSIAERRSGPAFTPKSTVEEGSTPADATGPTGRSPRWTTAIVVFCLVASQFASRIMPTGGSLSWVATIRTVTLSTIEQRRGRGCRVNYPPGVGSCPTQL